MKTTKGLIAIFDVSFEELKSDPLNSHKDVLKLLCTKKLRRVPFFRFPSESLFHMAKFDENSSGKST